MDTEETPEGMVFPCEIDIKVFMKSSNDNESLVNSLIVDLIGSSQLIHIQSKESSKGKYQSLSCRVKADSKIVLDNLFVTLSGHPDIVMVI